MTEEFRRLEEFLGRVPGLAGTIGKGHLANGNWWVKFKLDLTHPLAWRVVQELAHVLNFVSVTEHLPTVFRPVSPPAYLNGGPEEVLSWVIESTDLEFSPDACCGWLEGRLPRPVEELSQWELEFDQEHPG